MKVWRCYTIKMLKIQFRLLPVNLFMSDVPCTCDTDTQMKTWEGISRLLSHQQISFCPTAKVHLICTTSLYYLISSSLYLHYLSWNITCEVQTGLAFLLGAEVTEEWHDYHWNVYRTTEMFVCKSTEMFVRALKCCYYLHCHRHTPLHTHTSTCSLVYYTVHHHYINLYTLQSTWYHGSILPMIANCSEYVKVHFQCFGVLLKSKAWLHLDRIYALISGRTMLHLSSMSIARHQNLKQLAKTVLWSDQPKFNYTKI